VAVDAFNATIDAALLHELPLLDRRFTWSNHRDIPTPVRLYRAFINAEWGSALFNSRLETLPRPISDHVPLLVTTSSSASMSGIFRFERGWAVEPSYRAIVEGAWARPQRGGGGSVQRLVHRLKCGLRPRASDRSKSGACQPGW
jgi:hypothetical protein